MSTTGVITESSVQPSSLAGAKCTTARHFWQNFWHLNQCLTALFNVIDVYWSAECVAHWHYPTDNLGSSKVRWQDLSLLSPPIHSPLSRPLTEGWHTSLVEVFLWVFPTQSIVTRDFTQQLNHESKMVWKWGKSEENRGYRDGIGWGGDRRRVANSHLKLCIRNNGRRWPKWQEAHVQEAYSKINMLNVMTDIYSMLAIYFFYVENQIIKKTRFNDNQSRANKSHMH